jgi:hypothetical protein
LWYFAVLMRFYLTIWRIQVLRKRGATNWKSAESGHARRHSALSRPIPTRPAATIPRERHDEYLRGALRPRRRAQIIGRPLDRFMSEIMVWRLCKGV